ncbi:YaiO family outer membrane beta-barrel protein [Salinimicrobium terrae]|uniref:YaiO family outer membrane beta-barrel protein n=1 Tax=Salinimicrobium terrae TaxID=470866 RepID=UPI000A058372|nr:YaiO family outer membrane beta-barrel protein [Salinimicrobium terrae]
MKHLLLFLMISLSSFTAVTQEINTDKLYYEALEEYQSGNFKKSLVLTTTALTAAPEYHDIRVLQIRNKFALQLLEETNVDLEFLLNRAPHYEGVKSLTVQRLRQMESQTALLFADHLLEIYNEDAEINIIKARLLLQLSKSEEARTLATKIFQQSALNDGQRYALHQIINLTVKNAVQVTGQYISFSDDYPRNDPWYVVSTEYQHNFSNMALIGRLTYSDRSYNDGTLYEIEAYPIFSEKLYAFGNVGFPDGSVFPEFRASASAFYNFAPSFEAEIGFRSLTNDSNTHFIGIGGLTTYTGKFYLNARAFIGPEQFEKLVQNYQFNIRYYLSTPENYLFGRVGSGISPDDPTLYTQAQENPALDAWYINTGINKSIGIHHVISISGGMLYEDLANDKKGQQLFASLGYRYKF